MIYYMLYNMSTWYISKYSDLDTRPTIYTHNNLVVLP